MKREPYGFARLAVAREVHNLKPKVAIVLVEPPTGERDVVAARSRDGHVRDTLTATATHNAEDGGTDDSVRGATPIGRPIWKQLELKIGELLTADDRNPFGDLLHKRAF